ncbi:MAG: hypothetical protein P8Y10_10595 [Gemmatimonadales bacterium]|jgi:hypothetical protein
MNSRYLVLAFGLATLTGCSSDSGGPALGTLVVESEVTEGSENVPQFSTLTIEGLAPVEISTEDGAETTQPLPVGSRDVSLTYPEGSNCQAPNNPRTVEIRSNVPNTTTFVTTCI